jgi:murein DD-endopeptidase MepM/ murein hydrolase activator NlpD
MRFTERLTILIVPQSGGLISFRAAAGAVYALAGLFLAGLIGLGTAFLQHAACVQRDEAIARLSAEKGALDRDMAAIRESVAQLGGRMAELSALERDVRIAADLTAIDPEVRRVGVGGPGARAPIDLSSRAAAVDAPAVDLRRDVEALMRQARFQRASLGEVASALTVRKESLSRLPSILPVPNGTITSGFGKRKDPVTGEAGVHEGVDVASAFGHRVLATAAGRVVCASTRSGYGLTVEIDHGNGLRTSYSHCSEALVRVGDWVERGHAIAAVGSSGRATAPHCHYEVRRDGAPVDPERFILSSKIVLD